MSVAGDFIPVRGEGSDPRGLVESVRAAASLREIVLPLHSAIVWVHSPHCRAVLDELDPWSTVR